VGNISIVNWTRVADHVIWPVARYSGQDWQQEGFNLVVEARQARGQKRRQEQSRCCSVVSNLVHGIA